MQTHRSVWQTWSLCKPSATPTASVQDADQVELRARVQRARVERHMTVAALGEELQCDTELLARFERGEGVLDWNLQTRLKVLFHLDGS